LFQSKHFQTGRFGDYLFYPSRVNRSKRQHLAVEAMAYVKTAAKLVVAGHPETPDDLEELEQLIEHWMLRDKVTVIPRFISEDEKVRLFRDALGCIYIPYDEDSYGYVTLEAYHSRKPVITCTDSGGTSIVVRDGETGIVVAPDPHELASAIDRLYENKSLASDMGEMGFRNMLRLRITWEKVISCLTSRE
jgi:glycosyltransferase involved in cell wall biosynthesis